MKSRLLILMLRLMLMLLTLASVTSEIYQFFILLLCDVSVII